MNTFTRLVTIRFEHCDPAGLIFYPRFLALVNEMVEDWFDSLGHPFGSLHLEQRKGIPTVRLGAEFISPVRIGDVIRQSLNVDTIGTSSLHLMHAASKDELTVARFDQSIVFTDLATMKSEPWPEDLRAAIASFGGID